MAQAETLLAPVSSSLPRALAILAKLECRAIALACHEADSATFPAALVAVTPARAILQTQPRRTDTPRTVAGLPVFDLAEAASQGIDGVLVVDGPNFPALMRALEPLARRDATILPLDPDWVVPPHLRGLSPGEAAWQTTPDVNYVARSNLRGHYLEFGTFWGRAFFPAYFRHKDWLDGKFFAFDSFAGLSAPLAEESQFTGGDFATGSYCCNIRSFHAIAALIGMPMQRLSVVPGFYGETLAGQDPARYGLAPESVSVCVVDCDLLEPTAQVLDFVLPLLTPGALIYFDDWRLCRASPVVGERAAALAWLKRNPSIELVEFHRDHWQHQWFIFQRRPA